MASDGWPDNRPRPAVGDAARDAAVATIGAWLNAERGSVRARPAVKSEEPAAPARPEPRAFWALASPRPGDDGYDLQVVPNQCDAVAVLRVVCWPTGLRPAPAAVQDRLKALGWKVLGEWERSGRVWRTVVIKG